MLVPGVHNFIIQIHQQSCLQENFQVNFRLSKPESVSTVQVNLACSDRSISGSKQASSAAAAEEVMTFGRWRCRDAWGQTDEQ